MAQRTSEHRPAYASRHRLPITAKDRRLNGIVYRPANLANYVAKKTVGLYLEDNLHNSSCTLGKTFRFTDVRRWRILDPACGGGELLAAVWRQLVEGLSQRFEKQAVLRAVHPVELLCGIDIDRGGTTEEWSQ